MAWLILPSMASHTALRALCGSFLGFATIAVLLRMYARRVQGVRLGLDDWLVVPAYLAFVSLNACVLRGIAHKQLGYSKNEATAYEVFARSAAISVFITGASAAICLGSVKLSALFFYRRIFCIPGKKSTFRTATMLSAVLVSLWTLTFVLFSILQCGTHPGALYTATASQYCTGSHGVLLSAALTDTVFELLVVLLPMPVVWKMRTSTRRRAAVTLVFLTAFVSVGASAARLAIISSLYFGNPLQDITSADSATYFMWILEGGFALFAVNLPSFWCLRFRKAPEEMLRSIRSALSLSSLRSRSTRASDENKRRASHNALRASGVQNMMEVDTESGQVQQIASLVPESYGQHGGHVVSGASGDADEDKSPRDIKVSKEIIQTVEAKEM